MYVNCDFWYGLLWVNTAHYRIGFCKGGVAVTVGDGTPLQSCPSPKH